MHNNPNGRHMMLQYQFCGIIENHFQDKLNGLWSHEVYPNFIPLQHICPILSN